MPCVLGKLLHQRTNEKEMPGGSGTQLPLTKAQVIAIFERADKNRDGRLDKHELRKAFGSLGSHLPSWRAGKILRRADVNGDGYISEDEIDDLIQFALEWLRQKHS
ncbi:Calcium-binding EF-hand [Corchorus capsularis]|uniref:Calcium-binding EF-hand n=1 Tax=Corchorus capsularis TaxID=210143 RepID=A0A1R3I8N9_COCAP|nr:Calcium-binding EF-hand [Corchorus capsularis]